MAETAAEKRARLKRRKVKKAVTKKKDARIGTGKGVKAPPKQSKNKKPTTSPGAGKKWHWNKVKGAWVPRKK